MIKLRTNLEVRIQNDPRLPVINNLTVFFFSMTLVVGDSCQGYVELWSHISVGTQSEIKIVPWHVGWRSLAECQRGGVDRERDHKRKDDWLETHRSVIWEWPWCCLRLWQWPQEASIQGTGQKGRRKRHLTPVRGENSRNVKHPTRMKSKWWKENLVRIGRKGFGAKMLGFLSLWRTVFPLTQFKALLHLYSAPPTYSQWKLWGKVGIDSFSRFNSIAIRN